MEGAPNHATAWPNLTSCVGNDCTWIHNHGARWPGSNVFDMLTRWEQLEGPIEPESSKSKDETARTHCYSGTINPMIDEIYPR